MASSAAAAAGTPGARAAIALEKAAGYVKRDLASFLAPNESFSACLAARRVRGRGAVAFQNEWISAAARATLY